MASRARIYFSLGSFNPQKGLCLTKPRRHIRTNRRSKADLPSLSLIREVEDLGLGLYGLLDPEAVMTSLATRLVERYGVTVSGVWMVNQEDEVLDLKASAGKTSIPPSLTKASLAGSALGRAASHGLPQVLSQKDGKPDKLLTWAHARRLSFLAAYPLAHNSKPLGVLLVACAKPPAQPLLALFQVHARLASAALHDAQLISSTQRTLNKLSFLVEASKALGVHAGPFGVTRPHPGRCQVAGRSRARHAFPCG